MIDPAIPKKSINIQISPRFKGNFSEWLTSVLSIIRADEVNATAKKNTILESKQDKSAKFSLKSVKVKNTYVNITPGATKSVNDGSFVP